MKRLSISFFLLCCFIIPSLESARKKVGLGAQVVQAAYDGNIDFIKTNISKIDPNAYTNKHGKNVPPYFINWLNPLSAAGYKGHQNIVAYLLSPDIRSQQKINVDAAVKQTGFTPLFYAVAGNQEETARQLLEANANVNHQNTGGNTPLHIAATLGLDDIVTLLIQHGADLDLTNKQGLTPLALAQNRGRTSTAEILRKAATRQPEENKLKSLIEAAWNGQKDEVARLEKELPAGTTVDSYMEIKDLELPGLPDILTEDDTINALSAAAIQGHAGVVGELRHPIKANVNADNNEKNTALLLVLYLIASKIEAGEAILPGLDSVFRRLAIATDLNLSAVNDIDYSAFNYAISIQNQPKYLEALLRHPNAKQALKNKYSGNLTPLEFAEKHNPAYVDMIKKVMGEEPTPPADETGLMNSLQQLTHALDGLAGTL